MDKDRQTTALRSRFARLLDAAATTRISEEAGCNVLAEEIREAESWILRRAAHSAYDRAHYRVGGWAEPSGGLDLDDLFLTGWDHLGLFGVVLLAAMALRHPDIPVTGLLRKLSASDQGDVVRAWGVWRRWHWLAALYRKETVDFLNTRKARMPGQPWRGEPASARQQHLIREISRYLQIVAPTFADRGLAFEWIKAQGGNPRFREAPQSPPLPSLEGL